MSLPSLEDYQKGSATWKRDYKGVHYSLSHHSVSDYSPQGTWCFYIHLTESTFVNADDFKPFDLEPQITDMYGRPWETFDYSSVPDYGFHSGITWYSKETYFDRNEGKYLKSVKIGCDYAHLWDRESGFPDTLNSVDRDAKRLIDQLVSMHPVKLRCSWSGKMDAAENFYTANNGALVHNSQLEKISDDMKPYWLPKEAA